MKRFFSLLNLAWIIALVGCDNMGNQRKLEALELPPPGISIRPETLESPRHTIPRDPSGLDLAILQPVVQGAYVTESPLPLTSENLARGRELYGVHCTPCHGPLGYGDGIVVRRGFPSPPTYHSPQLRGAPLGYFYDVITHGYGVMAPYGGRVAPEDRWRVAAFVRVLQWSQHVTPESVPADQWTFYQQRLSSQ